MMSETETITSAADKTGLIGAIIAAMGCAVCFPALGSLAAAIGLGFLSQYEGTFIHYLLPVFAIIALVANIISGRRHRNWPRMVLGVTGPLLVLAAALLMAGLGWPTEWLLYPGLALMIIVSILDLAAPAGKRRPSRL